MDILFIVFVFIFGLLFGSLANAVACRLETGEDFVFGRSHCPSCRRPLSFFDLIPVISFVFLAGKCRYCQKPISWQYPLVEIITGLAFVFLVLKTPVYGLAELFRLAVIFLTFTVLEIVFIYDLKNYLISDFTVLAAIIAAIAYKLSFLPFIAEKQLTFQFLAKDLLFAVVLAFFFWLLAFLSKEKWLGFGDAGLVFFIGLFFGFPMALAALFCAFLIGAIIGLGLIIFKQKTFKSQLPLAPLLIIGFWLAFFFGENMIFWYLSVLPGLLPVF